MANPEVRDKLVATLGADTALSTPEAFGALLRKEIVTWMKVVKEMNIKVE